MKLKKWMLIGGVVMLTAFTAAGCGTENKENNKNNKQRVAGSSGRKRKQDIKRSICRGFYRGGSGQYGSVERFGQNEFRLQSFQQYHHGK